MSEVAVLSARLHAEIGQYLRGMQQADGVTADTRRRLQTLEAQSRSTEAALNRVRVTNAQAAEAKAALATVERSVSGVTRAAVEAADRLDAVKLGGAQTAAFKAEAKIMEHAVEQIGDEAVKTRAKLAAVGGGFGGASRAVRGILPGGARISPGAIGTLGVAAASILPQLAPATLAVTGLLEGFNALVATAAVVKAAFAGITKEAFTQQEAFDKLDATQKELVQTLRSLDAGLLKSLQSIARGNVLPEVSQALRDAFSPQTTAAITNSVESISRTIGSEVGKWGRYIGSSEFASQFGQMMQRDSGYVADLSSEFRNLFSATMHFLNAGGEFTNWMSKGILHFTEWANAAARSGQETGKLARVFESAKTAIQDLGRILGSLWHALDAIFKVLGPTGGIAINLLTGALEGLAAVLNQNREQFAAFFKGAAQAVSDLFSALKLISPILKDIVDMIGAVAKAFGGWRFIIDGVIALMIGRMLLLKTGLLAVGGAGVTAGAGIATGAAAANVGILATTRGVGGLKAALLGINGMQVVASVIIGTILSKAAKAMGSNDDRTKEGFGPIQPDGTRKYAGTGLYVPGYSPQEIDAQRAAQPPVGVGGANVPASPPKGLKGPDTKNPLVDGLNADFAKRLQELEAAVRASGGNLSVYSGSRDAGRQAVLYAAAVKKYGSEAEARKWVAPPGRSNHDPNAGIRWGMGEGALAADLSGDLALARKLAPRFGLTFPLSNENWHVEPAGLRDSAFKPPKDLEQPKEDTSLRAILPAKYRAALATAEIAQVRDPVKGSREVIAAAQAALKYLEAQKATGEMLVAIEQERKALVTDIAGAQDKIAAALKEELDARKELSAEGRKALLEARQAAAGALERKILGLPTPGADTTPGLFSLRSAAKKTAALLADSPLADSAALRKQIDVINRVLAESFAPPDVRQAVRDRLAALATTAKQATKDAFASVLETAKQSVKDAKASAKQQLADSRRDEAARQMGILTGAGIDAADASPTAARLKKQLAAIQKEIDSGKINVTRTTRGYVEAISRVLGDGIVGQDVINTVAQRLAAIDQAMKQGLATATENAKQAVQDQRATVLDVLSQVMASADNLFQQATATKVDSMRATMTAHLQEMQDATSAKLAAMRQASSAELARMQAETQAHIRTMQVSVSGFGGDFTFGADKYGTLSQTPSQIALAALQEQQNQQGLQEALTAAQEAKQHAIDWNDHAALDAATKQLLRAQQAIQMDALQKQATLEQTAAQHALQDAQEAYQAGQDKAIQTYQDVATAAEEGYLKTQTAAQEAYRLTEEAAIKAFELQRSEEQKTMDIMVKAIMEGMADGSVEALAGITEITKILTDHGVDAAKAGFILGNNLYAGLDDGLRPVFALIKALQDAMKAVHLLDPSSPDVTAPWGPGLPIWHKPGSGPQAYASGTDYASGGLAWVGEAGKELMQVPRGSKIASSSQTRSMLTSGGTTVIQITLEPQVIELDGRELARGTRKQLLRIQDQNDGLGFN